MNIAQRIILLATSGVIVWILAHPPMNVLQGNFTFNAGFGSGWGGVGDQVASQYIVNTTHLCVLVMGVAVAGAFAAFAFKDWNSTAPSEQD